MRIFGDNANPQQIPEKTPELRLISAPAERLPVAGIRVVRTDPRSAVTRREHRLVSAQRSLHPHWRDLLMRLITSMAILAVSALPALADRQVTEDERTKLVAAVQAEGCSGGKYEMDEDDQQFEVDDAVCADGKKYDLKFDMQMRLKRKNLD
jgi:hypothetical protein